MSSPRFVPGLLVAAALTVTVPAAAAAAPAGPVSGMTQVAEATQDALPVKSITIAGNERTQEAIIRRELTTIVGEPFDPDTLRQDIELLDRLDVFATIDITHRSESDGVVVEIVVTESHPFVPSVSVQITDENGVSAGGGVKFNNLGGRGVKGGFRALFGGATTLEAQLNNPWVAGNHLSYDVHYWHLERDNGLLDFFEKSNELQLETMAWLGTDGRIGGRFSVIDLRAEQKAESTTSNFMASDGITVSDDGQDFVLEPAVFVGLDSRDLVSNTRDGWHNEIEIRNSGGIKGSKELGHWQLTLDLRRYVPAGRRHAFVFMSLARLRSGSIGTEIAPWQAYYTGGTNSVRGWDLGQLGPGRNEWLNTFEYRFTILEPQGWILPWIKWRYRGGLHVAAFADLGSNWNEGRELSLDRSIAGAGIGLRLMVPFVGIVRFDAAMGQDGKVRFHIGSFEKPVMSRRRVR